MSTVTVVESKTIVDWLQGLAADVRGQADHLTQLDAAIGDGDHGINMNRGCEAVVAALDEQGADLPPGKLLVLAGRTLVSKVGGASGPLYGSLLRGAGRALGDDAQPEGPALAEALAAGVKAVQELGAAVPGDKTMVDALVPAVGALRSALERGDALGAATAAAADAAAEAARATVPLQARKGRASYLGERSVGHEDPGAASTALVFAALARAVG
ncbi:MAG TPA: dihydroxyacetone kinase subunit DhaL [Baekduia sp.]|uniref:dihydroxyacetone kinase subunit DhaL n=1 Tax=Baekduia sp. TaxID=2600305 RepID=UPI002D77C14F|nr:dihydroxyacetone kinase subunit DhaL [Baekduia sp.]HET6506942.1 dihydroxyacetone kinase subunit DhaL [Baekduia sp.]